MMTINSTHLSFSFENQEFPTRIREFLSKDITGYWRVSFDHKDADIPNAWFLGVAQGRVVFTGSEKMQWLSLTQTLQNFIKKLRSDAGQQDIRDLQAEMVDSQAGYLGKLLIQLEHRHSFSHSEAIEALRLSILLDMEKYFFNYSGQAFFTPEPDLLANSPMRGFDWNILLLDLVKRQQEWAKLKSIGFSSVSTLMLDTDALTRSGLAERQKQQLQMLIGDEKRLDEIAYLMAKDPLEVAINLSRLAEKGLISVKSDEKFKPTVDRTTEIFIVDDSPILVKQFQALLSRWGYQVVACNDPLKAVHHMQSCHPAVIFLDINMPGASGFELIKQIRRIPHLSVIPIVLLTAEKTVSNQFRAQWASCKFLAKPLTSDAVSGFKTDLYNVLKELVVYLDVEDAA
jgi:CheY-like chemotaxis protein